MTKNKKEFVEELSKVFAKHLWPVNIAKLEYFKPGKTYEEEVVVTFTNGYQRIANVHCDSCLAIVKDLCKQVLEDL